MGDTLGQFELVRLIGRGGMGEVHLAHDSRLQRTVALKLLPPELAEDQDRRARFLREARAAAALNHPNITTVHEVGEQGGRSYIAQEYLAGETLASLLAERSLPLEEVVDIAEPLADALAYAHEQGVIHRDLKAANVIVTERGVPKLLDFGLAKWMVTPEVHAAADPHVTIGGEVLGTPTAMSPEQALGKPVDARSDVFSFGSLLYEMCTGRPPFLGPTALATMENVLRSEPPSLASARPDLPADFVQIVERALRKDPAERYPSMSELRADLGRFHQQLDSGQLPAVTGGPGWGRRIGVAVLALLAATALWLAALFLGDDEAAAPSSGASSLVGVLYFENLADPDDSDRLASMLTRLLGSELSADESLAVLSQQRLFDVSRRLGGPEARVDRTNASLVAREAGLQVMIVGELSRVGERFVASSTLVDVESGRTLASHRAQGTAEEELFDMARELGRHARGALGGVDAPAEPAGLTDSTEAMRAFVTGEEALQHSRFAEATAAFDEAVRLDPDFALAHLRRALAGVWRGERQENLDAIERARRHADRLPRSARRQLDVVALYVDDRLAECLPLLEALIADDPDDKDLHYLLGEVRTHSAEVNDYEASRAAFERVLELDPHYTLVWEHLADALIAAGRADEAARRLAGWEREEPGLVTELERSLGRRYGPLPGWPEPVGSEPTESHDFPMYAFLLEVAQEDWAALDDVLHAPVDGWIEATRERYARGDLRCMRSANAAKANAFRGRFDRFERLAAAAVAEQPPHGDNMGPNTLSDVLTLQAAFALLVDDEAACRAALEAAGELPRAQRRLYDDVRLWLGLGDEGRARAALDELDAAADRALSPMAPYYRDAARAEWHLHAGVPERALPLLERVVAEVPPFGDGYAYEGSAFPRFQDALARARLASGDAEGARDAWRALVDSTVTRGSSPFTWVPALFTLGTLELDAGNEAQGRALLERYLEFWGQADRELPQVAEARRMLGR